MDDPPDNQPETTIDEVARRARFLRLARKRLGLMQKELAALLNLTRTSVARFEAGTYEKHMPPRLVELAVRHLLTRYIRDQLRKQRREQPRRKLRKIVLDSGRSTPRTKKHKKSPDP